MAFSSFSGTSINHLGWTEATWTEDRKRREDLKKGGGEDEWMCGRQQEEKQGRKVELFYLESVLSGRPLDQIYTSDLWGFHLVPEWETERGNAEEREASWAGDGTLLPDEWVARRATGVSQCKHSSILGGEEEVTSSVAASISEGWEDRWLTEASSPKPCTSILMSSAGQIQTQQVRGWLGQCVGEKGGGATTRFYG